MKLAVLGGAGRLGAWITRFLIAHNIQTVIATPDLKKHKRFIDELGLEAYSDNVNAVKSADGVIISVPLEDTVTVLKEITPHIKQNSFIIEVSSIKTPVEKFLKENSKILLEKNISLLSIKPIFGPGAKTIKRKNIILIPYTGNENILRRVKEFLQREEARIVESTYREHDQKVAFTLALPHFLTMLFTAVISSNQFKNDLKNYAGTSFKILKLLSESLPSESWKLYSHIQMINNYTVNVLESLKTHFNKLFEIIINKDIEGFKQFWNNNILPVDDDKTNWIKSYKKIYNLIEKI
ncbi:MAG: prephenate dehydrogenase/arogenate dehydrogenase family protein [Candidatus Odinarchaeota archaeon]